MIENMKKRYPYLSDYLFINLLNTVNGRNNIFSDFLEEDLIHTWLLLMQEIDLVDSKQVDKINESTIDIKKIQLFREKCRSYFLEPEKEVIFLKYLASFTEKSPLFFDKKFRPIPSKGGADGIISLISFDILTIHSKGLFPKIKKCNSSSCYAFFVDKSGKRKWCSMEACGNRTKASRHYAKKNNNQIL